MLHLPKQGLVLASGVVACAAEHFAPERRHVIVSVCPVARQALAALHVVPVHIQDNAALALHRGTVEDWEGRVEGKCEESLEVGGA